MSWFVDEIVDAGKLPLVLSFVAFVVTFLVTRGITRLIRSGRGPFKDNVSEGGLHVHHAVPGILVLVVGAFTAVGARGTEPWTSIAGVLVGIGAGLVLDEFALILRLDDVYWAQEGRISVEMVGLAAGCLGMVLVFGSPLADDLGTGGWTEAFIGLSIHYGLLVLTAVKGKYRTALFGIFIPLVGTFGAIRLARPSSRWARRRYDERKLDRAMRRAGRSDARWAPIMSWLGDTVAGAATDPAPDPNPDPDVQAVAPR